MHVLKCTSFTNHKQRGSQMKKFLAIYTGSPLSLAHEKWLSVDSATRKEREKKGMTEWKNWSKEYSKAIVDLGSPLGKTKEVNSNGITDIENNLTAFVIIKAESHEAAAKIFLKHPHFTIFPGESVEIMECLSMPE